MILDKDTLENLNDAFLLLQDIKQDFYIIKHSNIEDHKLYKELAFVLEESICRYPDKLIMDCYDLAIELNKLIPLHKYNLFHFYKVKCYLESKNLIELVLSSIPE